MTGMAYKMRLIPQGVYERKDAKEVRKLFRNWCAWWDAVQRLTGELLERMGRVAIMVKDHLEGA